MLNFHDCLYNCVRCFSQVNLEYLELSKTGVMDLREIQVSLERRAEWVGLDTRDLLGSVIHQPAREHQWLENLPTPKTKKKKKRLPAA